MNSWWIYFLIAFISCHMHHIDIYLDNVQFLTKNQNFLGIGHKKLGISIENGMRMITKWICAPKLESQNHWLHWPGGRPVADRSIGCGLVDRFVGVGIFKRFPCPFFCIVLLRSLRFFTSFGFWRLILMHFGPIDLFLGEFWRLWRLGFPVWVVFSSLGVSQSAPASITLYICSHGFRVWASTISFSSSCFCSVSVFYGPQARARSL